jgi:hypothetical protein
MCYLAVIIQDIGGSVVERRLRIRGISGSNLTESFTEKCLKKLLGRTTQYIR